MSASDHPAAHLAPIAGGAPALPWFWLGTWSLGGEGFGFQDASESLAVLNEAFELGVRHVDTAGFYAHGRSEELVAKAYGQRRREIFISTKGGLVWRGRHVEHRASPEALRAQLTESLRRLCCDYIDLFQLHWPDPDVPVLESIDGLRALVSEGLVRHWGVGNFDSNAVTQFLVPGKRVPHQLHFNPLVRADDRLQAGADNDRTINCVVSPLEQGLLAGGHAGQGQERLGKKDVRQRNQLFADPAALAWVRQLERLCEDAPISQVSAVLLWILAQPDVHVVIPGPRSRPQLVDALAHVGVVDGLALGGRSGDPVQRSSQQIEQLLGPGLWRHLQQPPAPPADPTRVSSP